MRDCPKLQNCTHAYHGPGSASTSLIAAAEVAANLTCSTCEEFFSQFCLCPEHYGFDECQPFDNKEYLITLAGAVCVVVCVIGFLGNVLTLLAIPYAISKRRRVSNFFSVTA